MQINPRILGILLIGAGVCAALPFQKMATQRPTVQSAKSSESIEWRSKDFTLEVAGRDPALKDSRPLEDRPKSPAFGSDGQIAGSRASLDQVKQPPALPGAYQPPLPGSAPAAHAVVTHDDVSNNSPGGTAASNRPAASPPEAVAVTHTITDGDTLEALAKKHLGSRLRWTEIYNANPELLDDPEVLPLGVTIVILPATRMPVDANAGQSSPLVPVSNNDLLKFRGTAP